jgi:hypothetical protein
MTDSKLILLSLIFKCPFDLHDESCPFISIYQKEINSRIEIIEQMQTSELDQIVQRHYVQFDKNYDFDKHKRWLKCK